MSFPSILGQWTALHDALYYPLSDYIQLRRFGFAGEARSIARRRALAIIAQIKGRA